MSVKNIVKYAMCNQAQMIKWSFTMVYALKQVTGQSKLCTQFCAALMLNSWTFTYGIYWTFIEIFLNTLIVRIFFLFINFYK